MKPLKKRINPLNITVIVLGFLFFTGWGVSMFHAEKSNHPTEDFINRLMTNDNHTLATYLQEGSTEDVDLVSGREALSETLGIMMQYALEKNDPLLFKKQYYLLIRYFMNDKGFIYWKLDKNGISNVSTNATVDDLRIIDSLIQAYEMWGTKTYLRTSRLISGYIEAHAIKDNRIVDYYDNELDAKSDTVTLSFIDTKALLSMSKYNFLDQNINQQMIRILAKAPSKNGFYAKSFNIDEYMYLFDEEVNMIDQVLVALNRTRLGMEEHTYIHFLEKEFAKHGKLFGKYNRKLAEPSVVYESPALYALVILFLLENGESEFAVKLYDRLIQFKVDNPWSKHYGGYSIHDQNTHIFDNLLPMIAERKLRNQGLID
ncbi:glycosyl hydrolase family 8 [Mesobacillus subterraneus]|uniref:glycosyl hydrolase family 8 n=1 Tax=Mesobacillus subterraneus TaxID=285983 RepID=UPI001CFC99D5|nr:glycosyl hydrolase family 8 [Mesobacillus subterraneus]WLR54363.1 glycosyl hydrolase family 8 [Mesobacillus subterraneus]